MKIHDLEVTGSLIYNGVNLLSLTSSVTDSGSFSTQIVNLNQVSSSLNSFTSSINTTIKSKLDSESVISGSAQVSITDTTGYSTFSSSISSSIGSLSGSVATTTSGLAGRIGTIEGRYATTGSNAFIGTQTITGSLYISSDLVVQGSSSLQNITASAVNIGANIVNLNTANPAIRFAGLNIFDSGSIGGSGSFLYDAVQDELIFVHRGDNTNITSSVVMMGPQTYNNIGSETYPTANRILKGTGNEHVGDSCIIDDGTTVCVNANLKGSGQVCGVMGTFSCVGIGTQSPSAKLQVVGSIKITDNPGVDYIGFGAGNTSAKYSYITSTSEGAQKVGLSIYTTSDAGTTNQERFRITDLGVACFTSTICTPAVVSCNGTIFLQRGTNSCNGLIIGEQGGTISADKAAVIRTAGGTSHHLFLTPGIDANTNACGYIRLGGDRNTCVGINAVPTDILHVLGSDNGITICSAAASRPVLSFINGSNTMLKLSANGTYGAIAGCTGDLMYFYGSNIGIGQTLPSFGFEVFSSSQVAITSNNTFGAHLNLIFNRENTGGTRNCFNLLADQNSAYIRTLNDFPINFVTNSQNRLLISNTGIACFSSQVCVPSLRVQSGFADLVLCGTNTTSPHLGGTFSITTNQDGNGRTIIGNNTVGRAMYLEANGSVTFNCNLSASVINVGGIGHYSNYRSTSGCFALFCASQGAILYVTSMHNGGRSTAIVTYANGATGGAAISIVNQVTPYGPASMGFGVCSNGWVYGYQQYGGPTDFYAISMNSNFVWAF
jgi:hypothetical protein